MLKTNISETLVLVVKKICDDCKTKSIPTITTELIELI